MASTYPGSSSEWAATRYWEVFGVLRELGYSDVNARRHTAILFVGNLTFGNAVDNTNWGRQEEDYNWLGITYSSEAAGNAAFPGVDLVSVGERYAPSFSSLHLAAQRTLVAADRGGWANGRTLDSRKFATLLSYLSTDEQRQLRAAVAGSSPAPPPPPPPPPPPGGRGLPQPSADPPIDDLGGGNDGGDDGGDNPPAARRSSKGGLLLGALVVAVALGVGGKKGSR